MFGIGGFELFLILLFGFLIFGPDKLPALAKTLGQAIAKFRDAQAEMTSQLKIDELVKGATSAPERSAKPASRPAATGSAAAAKAAPAPVPAPQPAPAAQPEAAEGAESAGTAPAASASEAPAAEERPLSFSERKARYERERQARAAGRPTEGEES